MRKKKIQAEIAKPVKTQMYLAELAVHRQPLLEPPAGAAPIALRILVLVGIGVEQLEVTVPVFESL